MTPRALAFLQSLKEVEAGAQEATISTRQRGEDAIQDEAMTCPGKSHCLRKSSCNFVSSTAPRLIVGALLRLSLIGEERMIEKYGKRYDMYTGMSCRGFGGEYLGSRN